MRAVWTQEGVMWYLVEWVICRLRGHDEIKWGTMNLCARCGKTWVRDV
jgi:hypothetical protein